MMVSEFIQELKHAFFLDASILSTELATLRLMTYGERLKYAIDLAGASRKDVAVELGVTVQAIGQAIRGETKAHAAENQARAARLLEVDYFWLATGEGKARPVSGWPFTPELHKQIHSSSRLRAAFLRQRDAGLNYFRTKMKECLHLS